MAQFRFSAGDFAGVLGNAGSKLYTALKQSMEGYDFDSKWKAKPSDAIFNHGLTTLPSFVQVQGSDNADGSSYTTEAPSAVTSSQVTVAGSKAYYRVLANR